MSEGPPPKGWTEAQLKLAREEWDAGTPTGQIARKVGVSKNSLIGVAHRRKFPPRPSPIRVRTSTGELVPVVPVKGRSPGSYAVPKKPLPPWPPDPAPQQAVVEVKMDSAPESPSPAPEKARPVLARLNPPLAGIAPHRECQWPLGEPGRPGFKLCGATRVSGARYPYCAEHYELAVERKKETTE